MRSSVCVYIKRGRINGVEQIGLEYVGCCSVRDDAASLQKVDAVGECGCEVEVVQDGQHADAA